MTIFGYGSSGDDDDDYIPDEFDELPQNTGYKLCEENGLPTPWSTQSFWEECIEECFLPAIFVDFIKTILIFFPQTELSEEQMWIFLNYLAADLMNEYSDSRFMECYSFFKQNHFLVECFKALGE